MHPVSKLLGTVCDHCPLCNYARSHPDTFISKAYEWHGRWCPAWKAQKEIDEGRREGHEADEGAPAR